MAKTIDEYLAACSDEQRVALEQLRQTIKGVAPNAVEYIGYGLAAFRLDDKPLVAFGASPNHCAFYPMSSTTVEKHKDDLADYETSKGTIRFQPDSPLPAALVRKLVESRIADNQSAKKTKPAAAAKQKPVGEKPGAKKPVKKKRASTKPVAKGSVAKGSAAKGSGSKKSAARNSAAGNVGLKKKAPKKTPRKRKSGS